MLNRVFLCVVYTQLLHGTNCLVDKSKSQTSQELLRKESGEISGALGTRLLWIEISNNASNMQVQITTLKQTSYLFPLMHIKH